MASLCSALQSSYHLKPHFSILNSKMVYSTLVLGASPPRPSSSASRSPPSSPPMPFVLSRVSAMAESLNFALAGLSDDDLELLPAGLQSQLFAFRSAGSSSLAAPLAAPAAAPAAAAFARPAALTLTTPISPYDTALASCQLAQEISPAVARQTLVELAQGRPASARGNHPAVPPASLGAKGCWLPGLVPIHGRRVQVYPVFGARSGVQHAYGSGRLSRQYAPRMSVAAWHSRDQLRLLLEDPEMECSHRCGVTSCFHPDHLVVEHRSLYQLREECFRRGFCVCGNIWACIF